MRTLPELHDLFDQLTEQRRQAWAESNLIGEGILTRRIEALMDEALDHPDFVKVPC